MKNGAISREPLASFATPSGAPEAVLEAERHFDHLGDQWGTVAGELADSKDELRRAIDADMEAAAEAAYAGKPVKVAGKEQAARTKRTALERQKAALDVALDRAGNDFARAIGEHAPEWALTLGDVAENAERRLTAALAEAQAAADELGRTRRGIEWLTNFDVAEAIVGRATPYSGGILRVDVGFGFRGEQHVATVLRAVADAVASASKPSPRRVSGSRRVKTPA